MKIKDFGLGLTYAGGFLVGFSLPAHPHLPTDHTTLPIGIVLAAVGGILWFKA